VKSQSFVPLAWVTVKPSVSVADWLSGLVTTTFQAPADFPVRSKMQVIFVALTTVGDPAAGMSAWPVFVSFTVTPAWKPVPARFVMPTGPLLGAEAGVIEVTVGAGAAAPTVTVAGLEAKVRPDAGVPENRTVVDPVTPASFVKLAR
jgi:hypothetical protein